MPEVQAIFHPEYMHFLSAFLNEKRVQIGHTELVTDSLSMRPPINHFRRR